MIHPIRFVALAGFAAAALAFPARAGVKEGVDAWQRGDYASAITQWRGPADAGDPDAQFNLAQAYKLGRGVPADAKAAEDLYRKAGDKGHAQAQEHYAMILLHRGDTAGAMPWLRKAADQGDEAAQADLGLLMFQNGNRAGAMPWIEKAAAHGEPRAQYVLGTALFNGDAGTKDWVRAYALMTRAAGSGLPQAGTSLSQMDSYIPLEQRQQGIALARDMETQAPSAIAKTDLPPSHPAQVADRGSPAPAAGDLPPRVAKAPPAPPAPKVAAVAATPVAPRKVPPPPAPTPAAMPGGKWAIQLGAFDSAPAAQAQWDRLKGKPGLSGLRSFTMKAGAFTRLRAGPLTSRSDADRACVAAKAAGAACFPVAP